ncbi:hypothetical protein W911_14285 [Hyphomicrobium nitrativorans NL23]|uniref:Uncharacterized protein n=1 Tax=Hyphomicrobium nitrativorans NL23 TaxID=1029756 RepID=V5SK33_9HYPH|nr:hypothetical protein [Hyphomicrobium nitrativorans]AHB50314.1 hypothetical protein W911_14285 [Hyphomicrobium nitrativorans NL23]
MADLLDNCRFTAGSMGTADFSDGTEDLTFRNLEDAGAEDGKTYPYKALNATGTQWEIGRGRALNTSGGWILERTTIQDSSNGGSAVNFGTAPTVIITAGREEFGADPQSFQVVRLAATGNVDISEDLEDGKTVDGVMVAEGDVVLLAFQTEEEENGPYIVPASGAASRHPSFDTFDSLPGVYFSVMEGDENADTLWRCTSDRGGTLGADPVEIEEFRGGGGLGGGLLMPGGRLTLQSGAPVSTGDVTNATSIYYAAYNGRSVPVWDGAEWHVVDVGGELSLSFDGDSGHTGYHAANGLFDLFYATVDGEFYFGTGPAWASTTARSAALSRTWLPVNDSAMLLRYGDGAGDTIEVPAAQATYLGTVFMLGNGTTDDRSGGVNTVAQRFVWNAYNRVSRPMRAIEPATSWAYTTATFRVMNANSNNRFQFVVGLDEDPIEVFAHQAMTSSATPVTGIGFDWVSGNPDAIGGWSFGASGGAFGSATAVLKRMAGIGFHQVHALEKGNTGATFYGTSAGNWNCGMFGSVMA